MSIFKYLMTLFSVAVLLPVASVAQISLEEAQNRALIHNKELYAKRSGVNIADAERFKARLWTPFNPEIDVELVSDFLTGNSGEGTLQLGLSQQIELGGQRGYRLAIADAHLTLAKLDVATFERQLDSEVRFSYEALLVAQERLSYSSYLDSLARGLRDTAQSRFSHGFIPSSEYTFLNLDYVTTSNERNKSEAMLGEAQAQLKSLLGVGPSDSIEVEGDLTFQPLRISEDSVISLALGNRYELQENDLNRGTATDELGLSRRERIPDLTVSAFYSRQKSVFSQGSIIGNVPGFRGLRDTNHLLGMRLSIPLPFIDRRRAEILHAQATVSYYDALRQNVVQRIRFEARTAYRTLKSSEKSLTLLEEAMPSADSVFQLLQTAYSGGRFTVENYLLQKDKLLAIRSDFLDAYVAYAEAQRELDRAVGLGWKDIQ